MSFGETGSEVHPKIAPCTAKVVLIRNHPKDKLRSMALYHDLLHQQLSSIGIECTSISPIEFLSKPLKDSSGWRRWVVYLDKFILSPITIMYTVSKCKRSARSSCVVHIIDQGDAFYASLLKGVPNLVTCHDVFGIRSAFGLEPMNKRGRQSLIYQKRILKGLKDASRVACVSDFTRAQLIELGISGKKCRLISNGLNYPYKPLTRDKARSVLIRLFAARNISIGEAGFIFHLSANGWYKNRPGVIEAYSHLVQRYKNAPSLILGGKPVTEKLHEAIENMGISNHVFYCPDCTSEELNALYREARLLFFPSIREGFGWPIIEAQASGGLVVTSNRAPMNEIGGDAAIYCKAPPYDGQRLDQWARCVVEKTLIPTLDLGASRREQCIQNGLKNAEQYSAQRMIAAYQRLYEECIEESL